MQLTSLKSLVLGLTLALGTANACSHHGEQETIPIERREELLKKWNQEVRINPVDLSLYSSILTHETTDSGDFPASRHLRISHTSNASSNPRNSTTLP